MRHTSRLRWPVSVVCLSGVWSLAICWGVSSTFAADEISEIAQQLTSGSVEQRVEAADKLARRGMAAVSALDALTRALQDPAADVRWHAARALSALGPEAVPAVPALAKLLRDSDAHVRAHAASALGAIGPAARDAVPQLTKAVADPDPTVRREAVEALRAIRPGPKVVLPLLTRLLQDAEPSVVLRAIDALSEFGKDAVPALIEALQNPRMRYWAILVLNEIGPDAADAVPALVRVLQEDKDPEVRMEALLALGNIGPAARSHGAMIARMLNDPSPAIQRAALFALTQIGYDNAADQIARLANSDDAVTRIVSRWALAKLRPTPENIKQASLAAIEALKSDDEQVRRAAAHAVCDLDAPSEVVAPALVDAMHGASPETMAGIVLALASCGPHAVPRIAGALENEQLCPIAVEVLTAMGPAAKEAVPALVEKLRSTDDPELRREIHLALASIGPDAKAAVPVLIENLSDENPKVRSSAAYALGKIGPAAQKAESALRERFANDDDRFVRLSAIWALLHVRPGDQRIARRALPLLIEALKSDRPDVRFEAAATLGELGPIARGAIAALESLRNDRDEAVRAVAQEAISKLRGKSPK